MRNLTKSLLLSMLVATMIVSCKKETPKKETPKEEIVVEKFHEDLAMPEFTLIKIPDSTILKSSEIDKTGLVMLKYFSPDCDHCQNEAQAYTSIKDSLPNIKSIWMAGDWASLEQIKDFASLYGIDQIGAIAIGKNDKSSLIPYYDIKAVPFSAIYKDNQLIKEFRGTSNYNILKAINDDKAVIPSQEEMLKIVSKYRKPNKAQ